MPTKTAQAVWKGSLPEGIGHLKTQSGMLDVDYGWKARSGDAAGTNPEELIAAAHAGCFSMALSHILGGAGFTPTEIHTSAAVAFNQVGDGFSITSIALKTEAKVPGLSEADFAKHAEAAKVGCPVSKALSSVKTTLEAKLIA